MPLVPLNEVDEILREEESISAEELDSIEEVEPEETSSESKMEKLEPGVYQDENGKYFQITKDGELKEISDNAEGQAG